METNPVSRGGTRLDLRIRARPSELPAVRAAMSDLAIPDHLLDEIRLMVSELVTNSIRHAGIGPEDPIRVLASITDGTLRVDVVDGGRTSRPPVADGIRPAPGSSSGWGLYLIERLSTRWGRERGRYWFEVDLQPVPRADRDTVSSADPPRLPPRRACPPA